MQSIRVWLIQTINRFLPVQENIFALNRDNFGVQAYQESEYQEAQKQ